MIDIFNEDCMAGMARFPDKYFDLAIVDPPYGYTPKNKTTKLNFRMEQKDWNTAPGAGYFAELKRVSKDQIVWGGNYFPELWTSPCRCFIYWHKSNPVKNFADGELAWTSFDKVASQFDYSYFGAHEGNTLAQKKFHPTQKPIALYSWLLDNYAKKGMKILDTHLGSGSSAIATHFFGADFTGFEIDKEYFTATQERIKKETAQIPMFI